WPIAVFAPDGRSSYEYAGAAAQLARVLRAFDEEAAAMWEQSARRAFNWAETNSPNPMPTHHWTDTRNLAAINLYRLTGESSFHDVFLETTAFTDPKADVWKWDSHFQRWAAWSYLGCEHDLDQTVQNNARKAILREADARTAMSEQSGFGWSADPWDWVGYGTLTAPDTPTVAWAYQLTGDAKYRATLVRGSLYRGGANPLDMTFTTGVGRAWPNMPLHVDSRFSNQPPPEGITVYGPLDTGRYADEYWTYKRLDELGAVHPTVANWPTTQAYFDVFMFPGSNEYTIHQTIAPAGYHWAILHAVDR
ncbi:MAG: glycoside hydrolase family 9 protein, partial [Planctomycetota bacterium]